MASYTDGGVVNGIEIPVEEPSTLPVYAQSTQAIHADDHLKSVNDVAPPLHVSTTFRYAENPDDLKPAEELDVRAFSQSSRNP